jgi:transcriptional regulator with XRE-family HTH domain
LGGRIKTITNEQGLRTADDLAVHLDMNRGHLSDIERGKREAGIITLQVIAWASTRRWPICLGVVNKFSTAIAS